MARQTRSCAEENRAKILKAAMAMFRRKGYAAAGVDGIMEEAGLTHGGFYGHFKSKRDLLVKTFSDAGARARQYYWKDIESLTGVAWLKKIVRRYLSRAHRDSAYEGCPIPDLVSELGAFPKSTKKKLEEIISLSVDELEKRLPNSSMEARDRAWATLGLMVGCMALSRAVADPELSEKILKAGQKFAVPEEFLDIPIRSETSGEDAPLLRS